MAGIPPTVPHVATATQGAIGGNGLLLSIDHQVWILAGVGVPDSQDGVGWTGRGSLYVNTVTGIWYRNTGTLLDPTWVAHFT